MTEVTFYHLTETSLGDALPGLVEKSIARGWQVTVQARDEDACDELDALLWAYDPVSFLPHGRDGDEPEAAHPVFVTATSQNPNSSQMRFIVNGADVPADLAPFERVALMFDGAKEDVVAKARADWKMLKAAGHNLAYWKQSAEGKWEKAA